MDRPMTSCTCSAARATSLTVTKRKRGPAQNGREPFTTRLSPDVVKALRAEAKLVHGTTRGVNLVIEALAREHLKRMS